MKKKDVHRAVAIKGTDIELQLSKVTAVRTAQRMIHLDELPDGTWRLIYNGNHIPDFTKVHSLTIVREDDDEQLNSTAVKFFSGAVGVVEATNFERLHLWRENHQEAGMPWVQDLGGYMFTVGAVNNKPVCISVLRATVNGHLIIFMEATSQVVDHEMIESWLSKHLPKSAWQHNGKFINTVDASNFRNVFPHDQRNEG